ncbi:hypothetical protein HUU05_19045 [candidate division KSB1 bacterium]|nr:hypothetical protein [candidate division KSB1 bacterium]
MSPCSISRARANEKLFAEFYQPYPNIAPSVRGELAEDKLQDAMQHYDERDFKAALAQLEAILAAEPENATAQFYAGVCHLKRKDTEHALTSLQKVIALKDSRLAQPAEWYLALAYLQKNDAGQARATLRGITAKEHMYRDQASQLLERLDGSGQ